MRIDQRREREFLVGFATLLGTLYLAIAGALALFGWFVHTVTMLTVPVACAAIVLMLDRPRE